MTPTHVIGKTISAVCHVSNKSPFDFFRRDLERDSVMHRMLIVVREAREWAHIGVLPIENSRIGGRGAGFLLRFPSARPELCSGGALENRGEIIRERRGGAGVGDTGAG